MSTPHELSRTHDDVAPLLAEHALGTLDTDRRAAVDLHVVECAACRVELDELAGGVATLEEAVVAPGPGSATSQRATLLDRARMTPQIPAEETAAGHAPRPRRAWRAPSWLAASAATLACIALAVVLVDRQDRIDSLERRLADARGDQVTVLRGASIDTLDTAGPFGDARAQVVLRPDAGVVAFRDVPAPPEDMVWQVWMIDQDERISSLGVIDRAQHAAFLPIDGVDPKDVERIIVTVEPAGGSDEPTAEEVAGATV